MNRSRRRRQFNHQSEDARSEREHFRFPLDIEEKELSEPAPESPVEKVEHQDDPIRREQQRTLINESRSRRDQSSKYTITKAREVPSAIHGTRKKALSDEEVKALETEETQPQEKEQGYVSPIIEELKRERRDRLRKQRQRYERRKEQVEDPRLPSGRPLVEQKPRTTEPERKAEKTEKQDASPYNVIMTPHDKKKSQAAPETSGKRSGPKSTMPPIHMLGEPQAADYDRMDRELCNQVIAAFDAIGVPTKFFAYHTNGVIGRFELSLARNFRLNVVGKLKEHLLPHLPFEKAKIIAPIAGTSNIGVEFLLPDPRPIPFSTLFSESSLQLRKNDYKFLVGKTVDDQIFSFPLQKAGHILLYGGEAEDATGTIDNILVSLMMNHNPNELELMIASDSTHYDGYSSLPYMFGEPSSIKDRDVLGDVLNELNSRQNQFRRAHVRNLNSFNQRVKYEAKKSIIVVVIDDLSELFEYNNPEAIRAIVQILKKGKPLGIHMVMNHSRSEVGIRYELLQMMQTRISFKDDRSKVVDGSSELVEGNDMLIQIPTSNRPLRVNAGVLTEAVKEDVFSHLKGIL